MKEYDAWTLKSLRPKKPFLFPGDVCETRKEVIEKFENLLGERWRNYRRKGWFKIVKVKLIEVE